MKLSNLIKENTKTDLILNGNGNNKLSNYIKTKEILTQANNESNIFNIINNFRLINIFRPIRATGGEIEDKIIDGILYRIHAFKTVGDHQFIVEDMGTDSKIDVLVVGGGGAGSQATSSGGGSGGLIFYGNHKYTCGPAIIVKNSNINIIVGNGGDRGYSARALGQNGNSSFFGEIEALGGGRGVGNTTGGTSRPSRGHGASGGGGGQSNSGTNFYVLNGIATQPISYYGGFGNNGGIMSGSDATGGGGGAGQVGGNGINGGGNGGNGLYFGDIFTDEYGDNGWFAGGGAGTGHPGSTGSGGFGGGGSRARVYGLHNTGGGGCGNRANDSQINNPGGSGIVLVRYPLEKIS